MAYVENIVCSMLHMLKTCCFRSCVLEKWLLTIAVVQLVPCQGNIAIDYCRHQMPHGDVRLRNRDGAVIDLENSIPYRVPAGPRMPRGQPINNVNIEEDEFYAPKEAKTEQDAQSLATRLHVHSPSVGRNSPMTTNTSVGHNSPFTCSIDRRRTEPFANYTCTCSIDRRWTELCANYTCTYSTVERKTEIEPMRYVSLKHVRRM